MEERTPLITSYGKKVRNLERKMSELECGTAAGRGGGHPSRPGTLQNRQLGQIDTDTKYIRLYLEDIYGLTTEGA